MRMHHIGIAVKSIQREIKEYQKLLGNIKVSETVYDPAQDAKLCMLETENGMLLELVEGKPVGQYLARVTRMYHMCYVVRDLEAELARMLRCGGVLVSGPEPAILFDGRRVTFLYTRIGLIELLEESHEETTR